MPDAVSVIIRIKNDPNIWRRIDSFRLIPKQTFELIIVDSSNEPLKLDVPYSIRYIYENVSRFEALDLGVKMARFESVLIIDSDQIVTSSLISELNNINKDICIIRSVMECLRAQNREN